MNSYLFCWHLYIDLPLQGQMCLWEWLNTNPATESKKREGRGLYPQTEAGLRPPCPSSLQEPAVLWRVLWTVSLTLASALWGLNRAFFLFSSSRSQEWDLVTGIYSLTFTCISPWNGTNQGIVPPTDVHEAFGLSIHNFGYSYSLVSPFFSLPKL